MLCYAILLGSHNQHLKILQEFWSTMDEIDKVLWIVDPTKPSYAMCHRRISLGNPLTHLDVIVVLLLCMFT
jgi:E3 ubiquitin-protein ligase FANCL